MTKYIFSILLALVSLTANAYTIEQIPNVHIQNSTRYVSNPDGILSAEAQAQADSIIAQIWATSSAEVVAVVVNEIDGSDIDSFATELFTSWGIGKKDKDNGLLVLIVKDMRKAAIRTGYGMEGVVPDIIAGRIIRNYMAPHFKNGDYDTGTLETLNCLAAIINNPEAAQELMSKHKNDANAESVDFFKYYLIGCAIIAIGLLCLFISVLWSNRKKSRFERYSALDKLNSATLFCCFLGLGFPLIAYIPMLLTMRYLRISPRHCPNCNYKMKRLSEDEDNKYLTPAQDMEERINSIDYDVWLCTNCGETDIIPYIKKSANYTICPTCGARACTQTSNRIVLQATENRDGRGIKEYSCSNCHKISQIAYVIPKAEVPIIFVGGGGGRGFGGGGGFSGGSFGGGFTGGGGASGGW